MECTGFSTIKVYVNDKKQLSFSWEAENSEVFIAWVKKCGISFTDNRIGIRRSTSKTS